jgi:CHASE1-domain containing sensor protein
MMPREQKTQGESPASNGASDILRQYLPGSAGHVGILLILMTVTLLAAGIFWNVRQEHARLNFERDAEELISKLVQRLRNYEDGLWAGVSLIESRNNQIGLDEWTKFATALDLQKKYPGINGMGVIFNVRKRDIEKFIAAQRVFRPEFGIHPEHENNVYLPITYVVPVMGNEKAVGLDVAFEAHRLEAALQARNTGLAQLTAPIALVQDKGKTPGFLYYAPYYDAGAADQKLWTKEDRQGRFIGMTYMPIVMNKFVEGFRGNKQTSHLSFKVSDGNDLLFDEHNANEFNFDPSALFSKKVDITVAGRTWNIDIHSSKLFRVEHSSLAPIFILIFGLGATGAIGFILHRNKKGSRSR